jgi:hypothetical protein
MIAFDDWCDTREKKVNGHSLTILNGVNTKLPGVVDKGISP